LLFDVRPKNRAAGADALAQPKYRKLSGFGQVIDAPPLLPIPKKEFGNRVGTIQQVGMKGFPVYLMHSNLQKRKFAFLNA
jgi:hypothetical protein